MFVDIFLCFFSVGIIILLPLEMKYDWNHKLKSILWEINFKKSKYPMNFFH